MDSEEARWALAGIRDTLRSAKRWQELLTEQDRYALLSDIARTGIAVGRDIYGGLSDLDIGTDTEGMPPCPIERLGYLRSVLLPVTAALKRIENEPPAALVVTEREVGLERARRISPAALCTLAVKFPRGTGGYRVRESALRATHDTPAVRAAKTIAAVFARDLSAIAAVAQSVQVPSVAEEAERLRRRLQAVLRRPVWRDLPLLPRVPPLAPTLRNNGPHRLLHDIYARYHGGFGFDWAHPLFHLPARDTWQLYEYWCVIAVVRALRELGYHGKHSEDFVRYGVNGLSLALSTDTSSRLTFRQNQGSVVLTFQRRFDRGEETTGGYHSRAQWLIPDIVVESGGRLLVLDAKFKTYADPGAETDDIRQMHAYRDAIRHGSDRPVSAAWLLFPGRADGAGRPAIAYPTVSAARPFGNGEVGALRTRPGDTRRLTHLLADFFGVPYTANRP